MKIPHSNSFVRENEVRNELLSWLSAQGLDELNKMKQEFTSLMSVQEKTPEQYSQLGQLTERISHMERNYLPDSVLSILLDIMDLRGLKQKDVQPVLGSAGQTSRILNGEVDLNFEQAWRLSQLLDVNLVKYWLLEKVNFATMDYGDIPSADPVLEINVE